MIGTISIAVEAKNPNLPLHPLRAFVNSPSSLRIINVPKKIGEWRITSVTLQAVYPDGSAQTAACVLVGGVWVGTLAGSGTAGVNENGYTVYASGVDENGLDVEGYVLGKGDVVVLEADGKIPEGAFAELSAQVQGKRDLDDLALPAQPSETVPVWYGATECAWDAETSAWTSEDGFVEVTRLGTSDEYDVVAYSQLEPVETVAVRARVRLALPSFKAEVETAGGPVEVRSFDGFLATEEWTAQQISSQSALSAYATKEYVEQEISGKADLSALDGFATEEYVDQSVSSKAEASSLTAYATNDSLTAYATTEYVDGEVSVKADLSALDGKRGKYDLEIYAQSVLSAPGYYVEVLYSGIPETVAMEVVLPKIPGSTPEWVWQSGDGKSIALQKSSEYSWGFTYQGLVDLYGEARGGSFNHFSIDDPAETLTLADSYFTFIVKSYAGRLATNIWTDAEIESKLPYDNAVSPVTEGLVRLEDRAVQFVHLSVDTTTLVLPDWTIGKTTDFVVDVENAFLSGGTPAEAAFQLSGTIGTDYAVVVPEGESLADMTTLAAGELAEFYFTRTAFTLGGLPTWKVVKQKVESWTPAQI